MKKNIWIINQYCGSPYHGMGYRSYYLAKNFINHDRNVRIFTGSFSHQFFNEPKVNRLWHEETIDNIKYTWIKTARYKNTNSPKRIMSWFQFAFKLLFFPYRTIEKPDCIIVSSISMIPIINGYLLKKKFNCKLIFEVRDIWPLSAVELGGYSTNHPFIKLLQKIEDFAYKKSDLVASVLPNAYEHMKTRGLSKEKYFYVPNGIDIDSVENNKKPVNREILDKFPKDKFIVGYAGSFNVSNNLDLLLKSIIQLKDNTNISFVLVGKGPLLNKISDLKIKEKLNNLVLIDSVEKNVVNNILQQMNLCFIGLKDKSIYRYGTSVTKLFDYLYAGKPILSQMNISKNPIDEAKCGINIVSSSSDDLTNAIHKLYSMDKSKLKEMGELGKKYVIENHTYENISKIYISKIDI